MPLIDRIAGLIDPDTGPPRMRRWAMYWAVRLFGQAKKEEQ